MRVRSSVITSAHPVVIWFMLGAAAVGAFSVVIAVWFVVRSPAQETEPSPNARRIDFDLRDGVAARVEGGRLLMADSGRPFPEFEAAVSQYRLWGLRYSVSTSYPKYFTVFVGDGIQLEQLERAMATIRSLPFVSGAEGGAQLDASRITY